MKYYAQIIETADAKPNPNGWMSVIAEDCHDAAKRSAFLETEDGELLGEPVNLFVALRGAKNEGASHRVFHVRICYDPSVRVEEVTP
jgi:hypothetical protein